MRQTRLPAAGRARRRLATIGAGVLAVALIPSLALANHGLSTLTGSNFEIDTNANLTLDHAAPSQDWGSLLEDPDGPEVRAHDLATGQDDNSYSGGVKEDTSCPSETTGSIPNNKSDLLTFHSYEEPGTGGHPGFFNMAWSRVSEPSGTTLMDFEFNQSTTPCPPPSANSTSPNVVRTAGDLLIEYSIDQGGARADLTARTWSGTAWSAPQDIDAPSELCPDGDDTNDAGGVDLGPCAAGTINSTPIAAADADGLGDKDARTFGEAQIDLRFIFQSDECDSFGSAMLKSRSSDAFTSQLKDFIAPVPITLQNCGSVVIRKETDPDGATADFGFTKAFATDPASDPTFTLSDGESQDYSGEVLFGTGYTVTEDDLPTGWDLDSIDCEVEGQESEGVSPTVDGATITFDIDSDSDVLDCTYYNKARASLTVVKQTSDGTGSFDFTSTTLDADPDTVGLQGFTLTTTDEGAAGEDSQDFANLLPGDYDVAETVPTNWNLTSATCDNGDDPGSITLDAGEDVTCTFVNERERGAIEITKTRKHAAATGGEGPHADVTFTITGEDLPAAGVEVTTDANGVACYDGLLDGDYTVTESVPTGYVSVDGEKDVTVTDESECGDGNEATVDFENVPLTDVTVSVDSLVDGGTASTISCVDAEGTVVDEDLTNAPGDVELTLPDLEPTAPDATLVCTITVDP